MTHSGNNQATSFIFVTGGVVSSLGKGLVASSIATLLQARGFKVKLRKLDPYLNVDSGTMSPIQHGEVFVTHDGTETDLDIGSYERFTGITANGNDSITTGKIYRELLSRERQGDYLGNTVQVIPHVTNLIREFMLYDTADIDFVIYEIGGTVGDIEALPFLESIRQMRYSFGIEKTLFIHVTLLPYLRASRELKTKPTQHSIKELRAIGIQPDIIFCRAEKKIPANHIKKIAGFCNVPPSQVIQALDVDNIYKLPVEYHDSGADKIILRHFHMDDNGAINLAQWRRMLDIMANPLGRVRVAVIGKYTKLNDAYKSLIESLRHGGIANNYNVEIALIDSRKLTDENVTSKLSIYKGIVIAGGFGSDGVDGKISAIKFARENNVPFFGICLGMQLAVIEYARNCAGISGATSSEFESEAQHPVISLVSEWTKNNRVQKHEADIKGGTMRLGGYSVSLEPGSGAQLIYGKHTIVERHRHRYEVNPDYIKRLEQAGMVFSGKHENFTEIIELPKHRWFIGSQFHPELQSNPINPHPLFISFIKSVIEVANETNCSHGGRYKIHNNN